MGVRYQVLIIRMRHVPFVDTTALKNLTETISQLTKEGTRIILSGVNEQVRKDLLKNGIGRQIGEEQIYPKFDLALKAALAMVEAK